MIGGVNFQPGQMQGGGMQPKPKQGNSVQEAIKILSLRLPKQVGPNALAPAALLNAQGSGGNSRIDSVVNTVMGRMFPTGQPAGAPPMVPGAAPAPMEAPMAPSMPTSAPQFSGDTRPPGNTPLSSMMPSDPGPGPSARAPRISPIEEPRNPQSPAGVIGDVPANAPPGQKIDVTPVAQPSEGSAPPSPTQDPWADLMEYLRRREPAPPQETPSI